MDINISYAKYGEDNVIMVSTTDITEVVEKETQLIQAGKMTTLGVMAAGMAHEINQPLNVIQVCADFFLKMLKRGAKIDDEDLRTMAMILSPMSSGPLVSSNTCGILPDNPNRFAAKSISTIQSGTFSKSSVIS